MGNSLYRDALDTQLLADYNTGGGDLSIPSIPSKTATTRPEDYDTDRDGMADAWERTMYGDLSKLSIGDEDGDGYTNIEAFFYYLTN